MPWLNKHLTTGPNGNSEFCFPETYNVPRGEPPNSKIDKNCEEIVFLTPASSQICRGFKEHDLITCESKVLVLIFM